MKIFKRIFCKHEWQISGWTFVKCSKCGYVKHDEELASELHEKFWNRMVDENHPSFTREKINEALIKRGMSI